MKSIVSKTFPLRVLSYSILFFYLLIILTACNKLRDFLPDKKPDVSMVFPGKWSFTNALVSNNPAFKPRTLDPLLVNAIGIAFNETGGAWVTAQAKGVGILYDSNGRKLIPAISIPSPQEPTGGSPSGVVTNRSNTDFFLSNGKPAAVLFAGSDGVISGWNPEAGSFALLIKNNSATSSYTGLTLANDRGANFLYAANFRTRRIDVYDRTFNPVTTKRFIDPFLPSDYSPFNIEVIGDKLYVLYSKVGANGLDVQGEGNGIVNIFNTAGVFLKRFATKGPLNSPWGIAMAPQGFFPGYYEVTVLIANSGNGRINVYRSNGEFQGQFLDFKDEILERGEGIWAIKFATSTFTPDPHRLFFAGGPARSPGNTNPVGIFAYFIRL